MWAADYLQKEVGTSKNNKGGSKKCQKNAVAAISNMYVQSMFFSSVSSHSTMSLFLFCFVVHALYAFVIKLLNNTFKLYSNQNIQTGQNGDYGY